MTRACLAAILLARTASAQPLPSDQWNVEAQTTLARCMVGESGWLAVGDHDRMAWVLQRRWLARVHPGDSFATVTRRYCASLDPRTERSAWVRTLPPASGLSPETWPKTLPWSRYAPLWAAVWARAGEWGRGNVPDPTRGLACHWGARNLEADLRRARAAIAAGLWSPLPGDTRNQFYKCNRTAKRR